MMKRRRYAEGSIDRGFHVMLSKIPPLLALCAVLVVPALVLSACGGDVPGNSVGQGRRSVDQEGDVRSLDADRRRIPGGAGQPEQHEHAEGADPRSRPTSRSASPTRRRPPRRRRRASRSRPRRSSRASASRSTTRSATRSSSSSSAATGSSSETDKQNVEDHRTRKSRSRSTRRSSSAFQSPGDFQKFLQRSGLTQADVLYQQRNQLLQQKLHREGHQGARARSRDAQIAAYYNKNKSKFATPERRDLRIVLTKSTGEGGAGQGARSSPASRGSRSPKQVLGRPGLQGPGRQADRRRQGPAGEGARRPRSSMRSKGKLDRPDQDAVRLLRLRCLRRITPAKQQSLEQSKASIQQILTSDGQRKALDRVRQATTASAGRPRRPAARTSRRPTARTARRPSLTAMATTAAPQQQQAPQTTTPTTTTP